MLDPEVESSSNDLMLGTLYARNGMQDSAKGAFIVDAERHPGSVPLRRILSPTYSEIRLDERAGEALRKAAASSGRSVVWQ